MCFLVFDVKEKRINVENIWFWLLRGRTRKVWCLNLREARRKASCLEVHGRGGMSMGEVAEDYGFMRSVF